MSNMKHISNKEKSLQMMRDMWKRDVDDMLMSPLAVNTDDMIVVTMPPLEFRYFDSLPEKIKLKNNGLTVTLDGLWAADRQPCIAGANLDDKYYFSHLHFHWTDVDGDDVINEHIVNGRGYKLEMHLIFFKGSCQTIYEAESTKNGFVTLAYLFNVTENQHFGIDHITRFLSWVQTSGQTVEIRPVFPLSILVHDQPGEYFTYCGKIDKRGCKCGITQWIVFTKTCDVNREQVDQFRCMLNKRGHAIKRNYRKANPVPPGNKTRPYLVVLDVHGSNSTDLDVVVPAEVVVEAVDVHGSSSTDLDVVPADVVVATAVRSRSSRRCKTSRRRSLAVVASAEDGNSSRTLCIKPTKTQLLRRTFNLNKLSVHKHSAPTAKTTATRNSRQSERSQTADSETENHLRRTLSFKTTRPSWK